MDDLHEPAMADVGLLDDFTGSATTMHLPPIIPRFFVPPLTDMPQNPIMDTLKLISTNRKKPAYLDHLPPELSVFVLAADREQPRHRSPSRGLWLDAVTHNLGTRNKALSWDRLRPSHPSQASSTGFLSEQDSLVFAAARYHVNVRVNDPSVDMVYVTQSKLLIALKLTVLGTSSVFHTWDMSTERFIQSNLGEKKTGFLLLDGKDEVISQSLISRFLTIGTLLRRLEVFLASLRMRSAREEPIVHAYAHALSTVVTYLRLALSRCPPIHESPYMQQYTLSAIWMHYEIYEETLVALADLYGIDEMRLPQDYVPFDPTPAPLLSRLYSHLDLHITRQSPRLIKAIFAFILTTVSHEYLQQLSRSVGYGIDKPKSNPRVLAETANRYALDDEDEEEKEEDLVEILESPNPLWKTFPDFFPPELVDILPAAQKSLILLQTAQPDHPLLQRRLSQEPIRWYWTRTQIEAAWNEERENTPLNTDDTDSPPDEGQDSSKAAFAIFRIFDLEPGSNLDSSTRQTLQTFIDSFPDALPPITPALSHLTSLALAPLVEHASTLSSALLTLFLSPATTSLPSQEYSTSARGGEESESTITNLDFRSHLHLLQAYLLLTSPAFKSRLASALFSDTEDWESESVDPHSISMSIRSVRKRSSKSRKGGDGRERPWAVGLAPSLLERETWPPVGADLSFFLRTVIVDSFEQGREGGAEGVGASRVMQEAEYRLGFAIRDLPVGTGKDKWLDPLRIEALDFLYMDYRPPRPLEVLIPPDIMSKYQRMFTFLLRLMRVESALGSLFRMTRTPSKPLFATLAKSQKQLLHFRFVAQSFVSTLSAYVFDTAIGGNFDPFIARLSLGPNPTTTGTNPPSSTTPSPTGFSDVFALAKGHSDLLDDVLTACLLRSGQRAVGEVLRKSLELVLEFVVVAGELYRGRMEEYEAAVAMGEVEKRFFGKMVMFTKVLKGLVDKNGSSIGVVGSSQIRSNEGQRNRVGGADALYYLYVRLDLGKWWASSKR